jgi:hypothetical protein
VNVWNHPVGRKNIITTDWAALNCLLNIGFLSFLILAIIYSDDSNQSYMVTAYSLIAAFCYLFQLIESLCSQTFSLLRHTKKFTDFNKFKNWFMDLKKCRPVITLVHNPTNTEPV